MKFAYIFSDRSVQDHEIVIAIDEDGPDHDAEVDHRHW